MQGVEIEKIVSKLGCVIPVYISEGTIFNLCVAEIFEFAERIVISLNWTALFQYLTVALVQEWQVGRVQKQLGY